MSQISQVFQLKTYKSGRLWLPLLLLIVVGGVLVAMVFTVLAYQVIFLNRVYPGVMVAGIEAGGMTEAELTAAVTRGPASICCALSPSGPTVTPGRSLARNWASAPMWRQPWPRHLPRGGRAA
jgi:hypothetical protein